LVLTGSAVLGYVGWQLWGTNVVSYHRQQAELAQLRTQWAQPGGDEEGAPRPGHAFAVVRIPRFGAHYAVPLIDGVTEDDLARGIGWFPQTARPGAVGNFVIAAHRITHGEPFRDFPDLRTGDEVVVQTRTRTYTYVLDQDGSSRTVDMSQTWILEPVPGHPGAVPTTATITMVTCAELFHTDNRNVVVGHLRDVQDRVPAGGRP
jgi:sortase A